MQGVLGVPGVDSYAEGHRSRLQGHYGENYVRAVAAAAGLRVGKEDPSPKVSTSWWRGWRRVSAVRGTGLRSR